MKFVHTVGVVGLVAARLSAQAPAGDGGAPQRFAAGVVSTGKEFTVTFTPDGREVYFTRWDSVKRVNHVMVSRLSGGQWQPPAQTEFSSDNWADLDPALSPDGKRLYFVSTRAVPGKDSAKPDMDIWVATRGSSGWAAPEPLAALNSTGKEGSPTVDKAGHLYFFSDRDGQPNQNAIYASRLVNGQFTAPEKLPATVNAGPSDTSPFVSPDGRSLLFYSTRPGGEGKADLYLSVLGPSGWGDARSLGPKVNTAESEYNPSVSRDGRILYFGRKGGIYEIPIAVLGVPELAPERFRR